jgi:hypothetical protein
MMMMKNLLGTLPPPLIDGILVGVVIINLLNKQSFFFVVCISQIGGAVTIDRYIWRILIFIDMVVSLMNFFN